MSAGKRKLTRADVVVVVFIGLFLVGCGPLLLTTPPERDVRRLCAANLAQVGKAMLIYANDYEDELPRTGGRGTTWGPTANWLAPDRRAAFGLAADGSGGRASISSCFYLLVKYMEMAPRLVVCPGDQGTTEFKLSERADVPTNYELIDAWDFGPANESYRHCSYTYHVPFGLYALTTSCDPNLAVAADRSPWIRSPAADPAPFGVFRPDLPGLNGTAETACNGNSITHGQDGQNVLFLDGRVSFETRSFCGIDRDNIYTISSNPGSGDPLGLVPPISHFAPGNREDSVLVHDPDVFGWSRLPSRR